MRRVGSRPLVAALAVAAVALVLVLAIRMTSEHTYSAREQQAVSAATRSHTLAEAGSADFVSIFVYDGEGGVASLMVSGSTEEFQRFVDAVRGAVPTEGERDDSFSDLLVFSYGDGSSLELPYSRTRNRLAYEGRLYQPAAELAPLIESVEVRFAD